MTDKPKMIVIIDDRLWKSICRDVVSTVSLLAMVGMGVYLESSVLQWIGGVLWCLWIIGKFSSAKSTGHMTVSDARKFLDAMDRQP